MKNKFRTEFHYFFIAFVLTLSSCNSTENPIETNTPLPIETSIPTLTPSPTLIPTKTPRVNQTASGKISINEIWEGEILITGDIEIVQGATLSIEPGTTIRFTGQSDDSPVFDSAALEDTAEYQDFPNDPPRVGANMIEIVILGTLIANGTIDNPIVFTTDKASPSLNDWQSLTVHGNGKLDLSFAIIEYNYHGVDVHEVNNPNVQIRNTTFRHIAGCCICTGGGSPISKEIVIQGNAFSDCNHEGIDTYKDQNLIIRNNIFEDNHVGIVAVNGSTVKIESNIFQDNRWCAIGIWNNSSPEVRLNNFIDNRFNICINDSKLIIDVSNNYWGSEIPKVFRGKGTVVFRPFSNIPFDIPVPIVP